MRTETDAFTPRPCTSWDGQFRDGITATEYLTALRTTDEWRELVGMLKRAGWTDRHETLAWRELGLRSAELISSDRGRRYVSMHRRLGSVMPRSLRPLVEVLVVDSGAPIVIAAGARIKDPKRACRLLDCAVRRLSGEGLLSGDRKFMARALETLDPRGGCYFVAEPRHGRAISKGDEVAYSATHAALGSWVAHHPCAGFPLAGVVASVGPNRVVISPERVWMAYGRPSAFMADPAQIV